MNLKREDQKEEDVSIEHAALLLFYAKKPITEENIQKIFSSIGVSVDEKEIKATVEILRINGLAETIIKVSKAPVSLFDNIKLIFKYYFGKVKEYITKSEDY